MKDPKKVMTVIVTGAVLAIAVSVLSVASANVLKLRTSRSKTRRAPLSKSAAMKTILASTTGLQPHVLALGLNAYKWAGQHANVRNHYLTIVDFTTMSKHKRMWVINMNTDKVVLREYVANGKYSGLFNGTRFSNAHGSLASSLGVYVTGTTFYGNDGLSMHVHGLQAGINNNAYSRLIEFHGAWYASPSFVQEHGRVGESWGCFAMSKAVVPQVVNTIKNGSVVFAYAANHSQDFTVEGAEA